MQAVLLAGGKGTRLRPYTRDLPKPLVPLGNAPGDTPVLELLVTQLKEAGVTDLTVVTGHLAEQIEAFLGDGSRFGLNVTLVRETTPLDTAGCLGLIDRPSEPFLMMNGDLLTSLNFAAMRAAHVEGDAPAATIAAHRREVKIDLGVLELDAAGRLTDYVEKPTHTFWVSMGVYVLDPRVCDLVGENERVSLPELILQLRDAGEPVASFREECYWLDIGRPDDYLKAIDDFRERRALFFPNRPEAPATVPLRKAA